MDLIRLIKIKKLNGEFNKLSHFEQCLFKYLDRVRTVKINSNTVGFIDTKNDTLHIEIDLDSNEIWCYKDNVMPYMLELNMSVFELDFYINKFFIDKLKITKFNNKIYFI